MGFLPSGLHGATMELAQELTFSILTELLATDVLAMKVFLVLWGQKRFNNPGDWEQIWSEERDNYKFKSDSLAAVNELFPALLSLKDAKEIDSIQSWSHYKGQLVQWLLVAKLERDGLSACSVTQNAVDGHGHPVSYRNPFPNSKGLNTTHSEIDIVQLWLPVDGRTIEVKSNTNSPMKTSLRRELYGELNLGLKVHEVLQWPKTPCLGGLADDDDILDMLDDMHRYCQKPENNQPFDKAQFGQVSWLG